MPVYGCNFICLFAGVLLFVVSRRCCRVDDVDSLLVSSSIWLYCSRCSVCRNLEWSKSRASVSSCFSVRLLCCLSRLNADEEHIFCLCLAGFLL